MKRGKLIVIEGTDGSGKQTQSEILYSKFQEIGLPCMLGTFPRYDQPFGKLIGGPLLGKPDICPSYFEDPSIIDAKAASMLYCAERRHELPWMNEILDSGKHLILDRYVDSNKGMQGGKISSKIERIAFYEWLNKLEHEMAELPKPDIVTFLYQPFEVGMELQSRNGKPKDAVEDKKEYLRNAENAYVELAELYNWNRINCTIDGTIKTLKKPKEIHKEVFSIMKDFLKI